MNPVFIAVFDGFRRNQFLTDAKRRRAGVDELRGRPLIYPPGGDQPRIGKGAFSARM